MLFAVEMSMRAEILSVGERVFLLELYTGDEILVF